MKQEHEVAPARGTPTEEAPLPMRYDVRIYSLGMDGNTLANAGVDINGAFAIRGVKVVSGSKGAVCVAAQLSDRERRVSGHLLPMYQGGAAGV